ncbi:MAG: heme-binding protein [Proteobacteria bacterium]|nr:MAG: heme-binding protein [Pseudomonadota bacterium]
MSKPESQEPNIPLSDKIKGIPGIFGIRTEEEPRFRVLEEDGAIEVREYEPTLVAKTIVKGSREKAMDEAFNILASYIYGENKGENKIEMTNPVFEAANRGNILSTTENGEGAAGEEWVVAFCLPKKMQISDVPRPNDDRVIIGEMPKRLMASIRFSGTSSDENISEAEEELRRWIAASLHETLSGAVFAQYDPPFAVPALRRNEVQIEIR